MKTTVILNPMNPWLSGGAARDRLLKYWESRQKETYCQSPLVTAQIQAPDFDSSIDEDYCQFALNAIALPCAR
jgi:hypothetical protein